MIFGAGGHRVDLAQGLVQLGAGASPSQSIGPSILPSKCAPIDAVRLRAAGDEERHRGSGGLDRSTASACAAVIDLRVVRRPGSGPVVTRAVAGSIATATEYHCRTSMALPLSRRATCLAVAERRR